MNVMQRGIATLIKSAVTGEKLALPEEFDLAEASRTIRAHHIGALAYEGALKCGIDPQTSAMQQLFQYYCKAVQVSKRQMRDLERVFNAFNANGIEYLPVKGCILKKMYPKPELRMMGDADVLIRMEQYDKIIPIMQAEGFRVKKESEHHFTWKSDALEIELHKCLFTEAHSAYFTYFGNGWSVAKHKDGCCYAMTPEDTFVQIFAHYAKHYRDSGVGCRHLVDLWMFLRAHPTLDETYIQSTLERLYLGTFYQNTRRTILALFDGGEEDDVVRVITDVIFANGSWGTAQQAALSSGVRDVQRSSQGFRGKFVYIIRHIFPGVDNLRMRYPVLKKAPYLLPCVWVYHLINRTFLSEGVLKRQFRNLSVLTKENVETRRQMLELVGLDYYH